MNKGLPEIVQNMKLVFNKRKFTIFILCLINILTSIFIQIIFSDKLHKINNLNLLNTQDIEPEKIFNLFDSKYFIMVLITFIIPVIIYGILAIISSDILFSTISNPLKRLFKYFIMYLVYIFIIILLAFSYLFISIVLSFIPILGIIFILLLTLAFIALIIYFAGYYRFLPYIAVTDGMSGLFNKAKLYIKGNFIISVLVIILIYAINQTMLWFYSEYINNIYIICIAAIIIDIILFTLNFFDIALVYTGKQSLTNVEEN